MFKHVYPSWHKPVQRCIFIIAAVLCITLPVVYGKHGSISSITLGVVLGVFFAIWLAFSLVVRFLVPSPTVEPSLPVYTHSPIRTPVILHSPTRSNAQPLSPAIRLHPTSTTSLTAAAGVAEAAGDGSLSSAAPAVTKGARFADPEETETPARAHHNVTFQTRPRGNTTDSTNSTTYPTFAAYRQAQHGNFDAVAQRVKRAFAISQQQQQRFKEEEELRRQQQLELEQQQLQQRQQQQLLQGSPLRPPNARTQSYSGALAASAAAESPGIKANSGTRSRSASAASMIGDIADRIKNGTFFRRPSVNPTTMSVSAATNNTVYANAASSSNATKTSGGPDAGFAGDVTLNLDGARSSLKNTDIGSAITDKNNNSNPNQYHRNNKIDIREPESEPAVGHGFSGMSGIEITVTPSADDHPLPGSVAHTASDPQS
ncbi:hypothetical protein EDD11_001458 [Mortierella claussenii]|nr:hypothetical protein EDD11_001458 [Mortierella claussenii]